MYSPPYLLRRFNEVGVACSTRKGNDKSIKYFGWKTSKEEATLGNCDQESNIETDLAEREREREYA
jgi:hypothetical protein